MKLANILPEAKTSVGKIAGDVRLLEHPGALVWIVLVAALVMLVPFMLFLSDIIFSATNKTAYLFELCGCYFALAFVCARSFVGRLCETVLGYRNAVVLAAILFPGGIIFLYLGVAWGDMLALQVAGISLCALGRSILALVWYRHLACYTKALSVFMSFAATVVCVLFYGFFLLIDIRARVFMVAAFYFVLPLIAVLRVPSYATPNLRAVAIVLDCDVFVQQKKTMRYALVFLCTLVFGFYTVSLIDMGLFQQTILPVDVRIVPVVCLGATVGLGLAINLARAWSSVLVLLNAVVFLTLFSLSTFETASLQMVSQACLCAGFLLLNTFTLVFSAQATRLKEYIDKSFGELFRKIQSAYPAALFAAWAIFSIASWLKVDLLSCGVPLLCAAILAVYISMFSSEVAKTRDELECASAKTATLQDVMKFARGEGASYALSRRECEIVHLAMCGYSIQAIAEELSLSKSTVKTHMANAYKKLGVHKRQQLVDLVGKAIR